jgi:uncharacterized protein YfkK (UPF0435 family)
LRRFVDRLTTCYMQRGVINMYQRILFGMVAVAAIAGAQTFPRRAAIVGGGSPDRGQCNIEVVVDGAAEVEIRGDVGVLRNLSGQQPQWRRFECSAAMPPNPGDFRFSGVDGRGKQELVRDPRNGGAAVVRIEDPDNGSEGYTFNLSWGNGYPVTQDRGFGGDPGRQDRDRDRGPAPAPAYRDPRQGDREGYYRDRDASFRGDDWRASFFRRVRQDLDHMTSGAYPFSGDRARLARTQMELDELQQKLSSGFYDERELDEVIGAMQVVMQNNRLAPRDRAILADDLNRMRDFRVRHDDFGARDVEGVYHREREQRFNGNDWRAMFFQHIREDLDHVDANTFPFGRDEARLGRTKFELDELQQKLAQGVYDERELDEAMGALQMVVSSNRLGVRDREVLTDDLARMREFRMRHEQFGAR